MKQTTRTESSVNRSFKDHGTDSVVAGFGSPHGDDQAGWQVVSLLERRPGLPVRLVKITEGTQLIDELGGCRRLIIVDACRGGTQLGAITRLEWPDPRVRQYHNHSTHGVGLCNALQLAERLSRMPPRVEIFGIESATYRPFDEMSFEVTQAVAELEEILSTELRETVDA